jgi:BirA family biotin operon repressor/biotin-[acetyl-CoA-carboxylase] ligase
VDVSNFPRTGGLDVDLTVLAEVASTNAYLQDHPGNPERITVVVTDSQTFGRGRQGRQWSLPPGSGLALSIRIPVDAGATWMAAFPLLVGGVVADVIGHVTGLVASLKWPNDILVGGKKVSGILCERCDSGLIAGIGVNLNYPEDALPTPHATSLHIHTPVDESVPDRLVSGIVEGLTNVLEKASGGQLPELLRNLSHKLATIGQHVRVDFPDGSAREGTATGIGEDGSLQLLWIDGKEGAVLAGDVWHVTPLTENQ